MTATGKWTEPGVPHKGWACIDIEDLGSPDHVCEMCEVQDVRYVHTMEHPDYAELLRVGCICAGHMEEDLVGARLREDAFKAGRSRRERWLSRSWRVSRAGNEYLNTDGFNVVVYPVGAAWGARILHRSTELSRTLAKLCRTEERAKLAAFDVMVAIRTRLIEDQRRRDTPMIVYCVAPIDDWSGWSRQQDLYSDRVDEEALYEFRPMSEWSRLWDRASELARRVGWEGDVREGPYISMLPDKGFSPECLPLIAWKQDNNGTTFIASPYRLPWLDECANFIDSGMVEAE